MSYTYDRDPAFDLEGRFLGFVFKGNQIKYIRVAVAEEELQIKLPKQVQSALITATLQGQLTLQQWDSVQISGQTKFNSRTGEFKLRAHQIVKREFVEEETIVKESAVTEAVFQNSSPELEQPKKPLRKDKIRLMICQKSGCVKKGGKRQRQAIENILRDRGLLDTVILQETGCLGKCSMAPNVVLMPGKKRLSGMKPDAIADLLETVCLS